MRLGNGGIDIFYIDESMDHDVFAMSAIAIPFLRNIDGTWMVVWDDHFSNIRDWRRQIKQNLGIPVRKELKGSKLSSGRGRYKNGKDQFTRHEANRVYRTLLSNLSFLPDMSIVSVTGTRQSKLYSHSKLEALLYALLQRMRTACHKNQRTGLVFFDEGHGEYRKLFRRAQVHLPTGSSYGGWGSGGFSKNLPLDNFTKDGNTKDSRYSHHIQLADLVSYAAFLKRKAEVGALAPWQKVLSLGDLYDAIPIRVLNTKANTKDHQGFVRL
jgi:hypothetical protein